MSIEQIAPSHITDSFSLVKVEQYDRPLRFWDDGFGPLWIYRCSIATLGVVRAQTWDDAYSCVVDEIMDDGTEADAFEGLTTEQIERGDMNEGYQYRGSGEPSNEGLTSSIASEDLNGSDLRVLTDDMAAELHITVFVEMD